MRERKIKGASQSNGEMVRKSYDTLSCQFSLIYLPHTASYLGGLLDQIVLLNWVGAKRLVLGVQLCIILLWLAHYYSTSWAELFIFYKYRIYPANSNFLLLYHSNKKCGWNYDDARIQQLMVILWSLFWLYDTTWMLAWNLHIFA